MTDRLAPRILRALSLVLLAVTVTALPSEASATVDGVAPSAFRSFRVFGDSLSVGNTLMSNLPSQPLVNSQLLSASTARVSGVPAGGAVEGAFVFWSGSQDPDVGVDRAARFTMPNGASRIVTADVCFEAVANLGGGAGSVEYFYCRADVTDLVAANPSGTSYNGVYGLGDVRALAGFLGTGGQCLDRRCQAFYAGWSMVMVWSSEDESTLRDVAMYDGFQLYDETEFSPAVSTYTIGGFDVADPPEATFRFFGLEGDALLGVPPQDSDPVIGCDTCFDFVSFNGDKLFDSLNPANNIFNSTLPEGAAIGVDIDSYDVSSQVRPGDTTVRIQVGSGDNNTSTGHANGAGGGELFLLGYNVLTINRLAPSFRNRDTFITADPTEASPGEVIFYTIQVTNDGSLPAEDVIARMPLPANTEYVAGSTRLDGTPVADVAGGSPVFGGMALGDISNAGDNDRRVTFRLRILPDTPNGTRIITPAIISASGLVEDEVTDPAIVTVVAPTLLTPEKTALDLNGGQLEPGDFVTYTIRLRKDAARSAAGLTFVDEISPFASLQSVNAGSFTDSSDLSGGPNGTGEVRVEDISMPVGAESTTLSFTVRVLSTSELIDAGVDPSDIDGLLLRNQGELQADFLPSGLLTDNPTTAASPDPTDLRLASAVNFRNASTFKSAQDLNGGALEPGDTVRFTISVRNAGNQAATVDVTDALPAGLENARLLAPVTGFTFSPAPAGANGTGELLGFGVTVNAGATIAVRIEAEVASDASNGTVIRNVARLEVGAFPDQSQDLDAGELVVRAGAVFDDATKVASGSTGGFEPGDPVTYTITFSNSGNQDGAGVVVTDVVDANLTGITPNDGGVYDSRTRTITWTLGAVAVGASRTVSFDARVGVAVPNGTSIANQAQISGTGTGPFLSDDPNTAAVDDPTVIRVAAVAAPNADKTVADLNGGAFEPGDAVRYSLVVRNDGRAPATNVSVTDTLPVGVFSTFSAGQGAAVTSGTIRWTAITTPALASIPAGGSVTLTIDATLATGLPNGEVVLNQADVTADGGFAFLTDDPATADIDDPTRFEIAAEAVLSDSEKSVVDENGGAAQPGDLLTYTIRLVNTGTGSARDIIVTDPVPANLVEITPLDSGAFNPGAGTITWTPAAELAPGNDLSLRFTARIAPGTANGTEIANQATIDSPDIAGTVLTDDPATGDVDDPTRVEVESRPDFATSTKEVFSADGSGVFRPDAAVVYRIVVTNTGTEDAFGVEVRDQLPAELVDAEFDTDDGRIGGTIDASNLAVATIPTVAVGESVTVVITGSLTSPLEDGLLVSNQAFVSTRDVPPEPTDDPTTDVDDDPTTLVVTSRADLSLSQKTFVDEDGGSVRPGDAIEYTILVLNVGSSAATDVEVIDVLPPEITDVDAGTADYDVASNTVIWNAGNTPGLSRVEVGEDGAIALRVRGRVASPLDNGTLVSNQAQISSGDDVVFTDDPNTANEDDPTTFQVISAFDFSDALKLVSPPEAGGYRPGDTITYSIRVSNTGDSAAQNASILDVLDPNLVFVSATGNGQFDGSAVNWTGDQLAALRLVAPGDVIEVQVTALIATPLTNGTEIANQALVTADGAASPFVTDDPTTDAVDDETRITVLSAPDLSTSLKSVEDEDGDGIFEPGDTVLYTLTVVNSGDGAAENVRVSDPLPTQLQSVRAFSGGRLEGTSLVWDSSTTPALTSVAPGEANAVQLQFVGTIVPGTANGTAVSNQALVSSSTLAEVPTDDATNGVGDDDPTVFRVVAAARLDGMTKVGVDSNGGVLLGGDRIEYTLTVTNEGTEPALNVSVTDAIIDPLVDVIANDGGVFDGDTVAWSIPQVDVGETVVLRFSALVRADAPDGTRVRNQAFVTATDLALEPSDDPATAEPDDVTVLVVNAQSLVVATKTVTDLNGGFVEPGDTLRYEILVRNDGAGDAERVRIEDPVSADLEGITPFDNGRLEGTNVVWTESEIPELAALAPGGFITVRFDATVRADRVNGTDIPNQATVTDASGETVLSDDPTTELPLDATVVVVRFAELDGTTLEVEDVNGGDVEPGDVLIYRLRIGAGTGPELTNVGGELNLDPRLEDVVSLSGGVVDTVGQRITWSSDNTPGLASIPTGTEVVLEFQATVSGTASNGAVIGAQARVTSTEVPFGVVSDDPSTPEVDDVTVVEVVRFDGADLSETTKTVEDVNGGLVEPGDVLAYTIRVVNSGGGTSASPTIRDVTPANTTFVADSLRVDGVTVPGETNPLAVGLTVREIPAAGEVELRFEVVANDDAVAGTRIDNTAVVFDESGVVVSSDDPSTPEEDDATSVVVGSAPELSRTIKRVTLGDENGDGIAQVGETLRYEIEIPNRGTALADGVELTDTLPENVTYVANSTVLNGVPLTDADDGDAGVISDGQVLVSVGQIAPNASAVITFNVLVDSGEVVVNQGFVGYVGGVEPTDDDGDPANGDAPTRTVLNGANEIVAVKTVEDANGGDTEPGDVLNYTLTLRSDAAVDALDFADVLDEGVTLTGVSVAPAGVAVAFSAGGAFVQIERLDGEVVILLEGTVDAALETGETVCNRMVGDRFEEPEAACVTIGVPAGAATVGGTVFRELGVQNGVFDAGVDSDEELSDFLIRLVRPELPEFPVLEVLSDADGAYLLEDVEPGAYLLQAYANGGPISGGGIFLQLEVDVVGGTALEQDVLIDPTGVVYDADSRRPVAGLRVWLYEVDAQKDVLDESRLIPAEELPFPSQQGQVVPSTGVYRFDLPPGLEAEIFVDTSSTPYVFPSQQILADVDGATAGGDERVELVEAALPDEVPAGDERYALRISADEDGGVFKNHIPVDAVDSDIIVSKRADRVAAHVGDIVTYTVSIRNESGADLVYDEARDQGGIYMDDAIPETFRYVDGSAVGLLRDMDTGEIEQFSVWAQGELLLRFGRPRAGVWRPLSLPANSELEIRYFLSVGSDTEPGRTARNHAEVRSADTDTLLSNVDYVDVRIEYDPVFDQGVLLGRAFCDEDGDGRFDRGESGLPGARIFLDAGYYADTDIEGQFHFSDIDPGLHLVKIDAHTLPPGSEIVSDEARAFNVTRGLPAVIDFGISCTENLITNIEVTPGDGVLAEATRLRRERYVDVMANLTDGALTVDGVAVATTHAQLWAASGAIPAVPVALPPASVDAAEDTTVAEDETQQREATALFAAVGAADAEADTDTDEDTDVAAVADDSGAVTEDAVETAPAMEYPREIIDLRVADDVLVEPLGVRAMVPVGSDRWVFEVTEIPSGVVVFQRSGQGDGEVTFEWDGTSEQGALVLRGERVYEARLRTIAGESRYAAAAPMLLRVAGTRERYLAEERGSGELFDGNAPNAELRALLDNMRGELQRTAPERIVIEAHLDDRDDDSGDGEALSERQAEAVAAYLVNTLGVSRDRIETRGMGIRRPLYPNIGDRTRNTNRRVEVRVVAPQPEILVPELPEITPVVPGVRLGEQFFAAQGVEVLETSALRPTDGVLPVVVTGHDGGTTGILVALRDGVVLRRGRTTLAEIPIVIDLEAARAEVAEASVALDGLATRVGVEPAVVVLSGRMLEPTMRFPFEGVPDGVEAWSFEVFERGGGSVYDVSGEGQPAGGARWQGRTSDGTPMTVGAYEARLTLRLQGGGLTTTPPVRFEVVSDATEVDAAAAAMASESAPDTVSVVRVNGVVLEATAGRYATTVRSATGATVLVDVMRDGARAVLPVTVPSGHGASYASEIPVTPFSILVNPTAPVQAPAEAPTAEQVQTQVETPFEAVQSPGEAAEPDVAEPVAEDDARRGRRGRRGESDETPPATPAGGVPSPFAPVGAPAPMPEDAPSEEENTEQESTEEEAAEEAEEVPVEQAPPAPEPDAAPSPFSPISDGRWLLRRSGMSPSFMIRQSDNPFAPVNPGPSPQAETAPETAPEAAPDAAPDAASEAASETVSEEAVPADTTDEVGGQSPTPFAATEPDAGPATQPAAAPATEAPATAPRYADVLDFYAAELEAALSTDDQDLSAALAAADAGRISVQLPPQGIPLQSNRLAVFGSTVPTNRVFVNGQEIDVQSDGRFDVVVELPGGQSDVVVETLDVTGNRGRLEWPVEVTNSSFFLMALADTAIGSRDADIAGAHSHNSRTTEGGVLLYGQARLYMQGWVSGEEVLNGLWDDIEITAHVDTGKRREYESFVRETIQPDQQYPVFGDASEQVGDVNSRGKVYLLVTADDSSATWGNFNTEIQGVELLRYERNLYGAQIQIDETINDNFRTELQLHAADEDEDVVQTFNFLRGTGGSVYYLENRQLVEGSERVSLVVRDSVSGIELARIPQSRNTDYSIRYGEGRIMMRSPVPSVADDGLLLGNYVTSRNLLRGHPVYLEVSYDHESGHNGSDLSYGAHARETFYDLVSIGGGIVEESRVGAPGYTLWGVEAGVGPTARTRVDFEYAGSESEDLGYSFSDDGGLTFDRFRLDDGEDAQGNALLVRASAELADVINTERSEIWSVGGYYQRADRGFFSNGRILDQGEEKFGFSSRLRMTDVHQLSFRLDHVNSQMDDLTTETLDDVAELRRQVALVQYDYDFDPAHFVLSYERTFSDDERLEDGYRNDVVGAGIEWRATHWLRLGLEQEIIASGDDPSVIRGAGGDTDTRFEDRFTTSVTAGVSVTDDIEIVATNRFRYSGENAALIGLRADVNDDSEVYVQQRFNQARDNHGSAMSTVVGGEQRYGEDGSGRSYGEYHMDHGVSGERSRAVLGFGKTWNVAEGLSIDLGFERSHTLAGESVESGSSRNTASFGWEYVGLDVLKLTGLFEVRFDRGSTHTPSSSPCLGTNLTGNPAYCRDAITAVGDRRQIVSSTTMLLNPTPDLTFFGRFDIVHTENTTLGLMESRDLEGTVGMAMRPVDIDWVNVLMRYTYLAEMAPYQLELNERRDERSHVFSLSPIFELPLNLQLVEKIAVRHIDLEVEGMPSVSNDLVLLINRLNYHLFRQWDVGVEYRFLHQSLTRDWRHGVLLDVNYIVAEHVRLGVGYNFTHFAEDELGDFNRDASGVFFRVTAQY